MSEQTIKITLDVPEGYEATGEYRYAKKGEYWLSHLNAAILCVLEESLYERPILRKTKPHPLFLQECSKEEAKASLTTKGCYYEVFRDGSFRLYQTFFHELALGSYYALPIEETNDATD